MKKIGILMMVLVMATFFANAQNWGGGGGQQREFNPEEMAKRQTAEIKEKCGLNADQEKKVYELNLASGKKMAKMREEMMAAGGPPSDDMREKMRKMREDQNAEMKKILTADQYTKYQAYQEERRKQRQQQMQQQN